jgi:hypothetical protein
MGIIKDYLIDDFIKSYKEESLSFPTLHLKEVNNKLDNSKIVLLSDSIMDKYTDILDDYVITKTLTDTEFNKYQCNPKLLSYDLYGTVELWFLLLNVNQITSSTQFRINPIKIYTREILRIVQSVLNLEKPITDVNEEEIKKALL